MAKPPEKITLEFVADTKQAKAAIQEVIDLTKRAARELDRLEARALRMQESLKKWRASA